MPDRDIILQANQALPQNDLGYQIQILNNYQQLHDAVKKENDSIYSTYYHDITFNSANSQQSKYVYQSSTILSTINKWGFWIYIVLAIILSIMIFRNEMDMLSKIGYILLVLLYPFYIYPLEELTYKVSVYIWNLLISVTYDNGYKNTSLEYAIASGEKLSGPPVSEKAPALLHEASYVTNDKDENGNDIPPLYVPPARPTAPRGTPAPLSFDVSPAGDDSPTDYSDWGTGPESEGVPGATPV